MRTIEELQLEAKKLEELTQKYGYGMDDEFGALCLGAYHALQWALGLAKTPVSKKDEE